MGTFTDIVNLRFTASTTPAQKELGKLEQSTYQLKQVNKGLRLEMEKLKAQGKKNNPEFQALKTQFDKNKISISENGAKMLELREKMSQLKKSTNQLKQANKNLGVEMGKLEEQGKKNTPEFAALKEQFDKNNLSISQNETKMSGLNSEMKQLKQTTTQLKDVNNGLDLEMKKLKAQGKENSSEYAALKAQLDKNKSTISQNEIKMSKLRKEMGLTSMTAHQLRSRVNNLKRQLNGMSKAANPKLWERLNNELKETQRRLDRVKAGGKQTSGVFGKLNKMAGGFLPAFGFAAISAGVLKIGKELFNLSKQMTGENRRANIVLGDSLGYVENQAELLSEKMGVTNHQFKSMVTSTADLLVPLDFSRKKSAEMSVELQKLTGALDEWTAGSIGAKGVSEILTKAMLGENEQLKQLGIAIRKDSEEFRELVKQKKAAGNVTTAQAEALATLELIQKKSADAQTSYIAGGNKLLRMQKSVTRWWQNMKEGMVSYFDETPKEKLQKQSRAVNTLTAELFENATTQERREEIVGRLQELAPEIVKTLDKEKKATHKTTIALAKYNEELVNKIILQEKDEEIEEAAKRAAEIKSQRLFQERLVREKISKLISDDVNGKSEEIKKIRESGAAVMEQVNAIEKLGITIKTVSSGGGNIGFSNITSDSVRDEGAALEEALNKEKDALNNVLDLRKKRKEMYVEFFSGKKEDDDDDDNGSGKKTKQQLETEKKLQDDILKYQQSITSAKIALMKDGIDKEKALENAKWDKRKTELQKQIVEKEKISELELEKNKQIKSLIESEHEVHLKKLAEMDKAEAQRKKTEKDLEAVEALENEIRNATNDEERWNARIQLADLRKSIELEKAKKHKGKIIAIERTHAKEIKKIEKEKLDKKIKAFDQEKQIMAAKADVARGFLDLTTEIFGKESALGKAAFVLKQAMAIGEVWFNTMIANSKAVAASWITGGQPWVGINTTQAVASTALITAQTIKGLEDGDYWSVQREQDKQWFDAQFKPRKRGYINKPTVLVGENNKRELVVSNKGVENKTLRPFLDIINDSQKNGTIETLDFFNVAKNVTMKGREQGGYEFDSSSSGSNKIDYEESTRDDRADAEMLAVLGKMTDTLNKLIDDGVSIDPYKMARTFSDISINKSLNSM